MIAAIWAITAVLFLIPNVSATASPDAFDISGGNYGIDYTYTGGVLTVETPTAITIKNADPNTPTTDTIVVKGGVSANITLDGVNIDVSGRNYACAFQIADNSTGNVTITLADSSENFLKSGDYCAGLQKNGTVGSLEIKGSGSLEAFGGYLAAGIGGGNVGIGSNITISGGSVTAAGGEEGAGIGGGAWRDGSDITISGGSVKTIAGKTNRSENTNAIGGGYGCDAVIPTNGSGEKVYPVVIDNPDNKKVIIDGKAYIPVNHRAADSSDTKLYAYLTGKDRTVKVGDDETEYLFSGSSLDVLASDLTITGNNLIYGTDYSYPTATGVLTILYEKPVTISGSTTTDAIAVKKDISADITLDGVNIDVSEIESACAFEIADDSTGNVKITLADGSANVLKSGGYCAGLQKNGSVGSLEIKGSGSLEAVEGNAGAGIGGGAVGSGC